MRVTQGCFSFLPDLSDEQIKKQIEYAVNKGWAISIEWSDDPHPRNTYWELWGLPLFDIKDSSAVLYEITECRRVNPEGYMKINAFDASIGTESCVMSFIVQRPNEEPGFYLERTEVAGRSIQYTIKSYSTQTKPEGFRY
uniref:Multifunctional fusion protein n=2 Tax=PX clade TaxID=569578 RepID=Q9GGQ1_VAULI|nr:ribulose-1,5-bisphosphate carboxylase/oxygenase small subunit [Vaucheria litorea]AAG21944.1 ribulose-1,5-bisphosphate carboxylase/oxygenase small subunit [Vaucheria litorea]ACF70960.1 ribulose-1,5-bisphosphate carboxylase/oxygenase small subunit [Vaucheria litorea]